jgi:hypothetical protein
MTEIPLRLEAVRSVLYVEVAENVKYNEASSSLGIID